MNFWRSKSYLKSFISFSNEKYTHLIRKSVHRRQPAQRWPRRKRARRKWPRQRAASWLSAWKLVDWILVLYSCIVVHNDASYEHGDLFIYRIAAENILFLLSGSTSVSYSDFPPDVPPPEFPWLHARHFQPTRFLTSCCWPTYSNINFRYYRCYRDDWDAIKRVDRRELFRRRRSKARTWL